MKAEITDDKAEIADDHVLEITAGQLRQVLNAIPHAIRDGKIPDRDDEFIAIFTDAKGGTQIAYVCGREGVTAGPLAPAAFYAGVVAEAFSA